MLPRCTSGREWGFSGRDKGLPCRTLLGGDIIVADVSAAVEVTGTLSATPCRCYTPHAARRHGNPVRPAGRLRTIEVEVAVTVATRRVGNCQSPYA
jgi:hypothetical protein